MGEHPQKAKLSVVDAYRKRKKEYEYLEKKFHPEYIKICEWLKENDPDAV